MAFDPDAYLAGAMPPKKGGFDPDAYLAGSPPIVEKPKPVAAPGPVRTAFDKKPWYAQAADVLLGRSPLQTQAGIDEKLTENDAGPGTDAYKAMKNEEYAKAAVSGTMVGAGAGGAISNGMSGLVATLPGRAAVGVLAGAGGGAAGGAAEAATAGRPLREILQQAETGGAGGALLSLPATALAEGAGAMSSALRRNTQIGRYAKASEAGVYKQPEMSSLPAGRQGMQEASDAAIERMSTREKILAAEAEQKWNMTGSNPETLAKPVDTQLIRAQLHAGRYRHIDPDSGLPTNDAIVNAYDKAIERTPAQATVEGTLKRRQALKKAAAFDSPNPTPDQLAARDVYHTFRSAARDASPELAAADDAFASHSQAASRRAELVGADLTSASPAQLESASARVGRVADENVPGMRVQKRLEELKSSDPEYAAALDFLSNKKAREAVRFGMPHMPTHLSAASLLSGVPRLVGQNARALGAQVADPLAAGIARNLSPGQLAGPAANLLFRAAQEKKRKEQEAATMLLADQ